MRERSSVLKQGFHIRMGRLGGHIRRWLELWDGGLEEMREGADELGAVSTQMKSQVWGQCMEESCHCGLFFCISLRTERLLSLGDMRKSRFGLVF